ncbi:MAG: four helix bundle protein [Pseudomonadota bacterium]
MKNFRCYQLAKELYTECKKLPVKGHQRDQLLRAALSICLNLAEGTGKQSNKERRHFFYIALGSQREVHCLLELEGFEDLTKLSDHLGASLYRLTQAICA